MTALLPSSRTEVVCVKMGCKNLSWRYKMKHVTYSKVRCKDCVNIWERLQWIYGRDMEIFLHALRAFENSSSNVVRPGTISIFLVMSLMTSSCHFRRSRSCFWTSGGATLLGSKLYPCDCSLISSPLLSLSSFPPPPNLLKMFLSAEMSTFPPPPWEG